MILVFGNPCSIFIRPGLFSTSPEDVCFHSMVGFGMAVTLFDRRRYRGGLCRFVYPGHPHGQRENGLFARPALQAFVSSFLLRGSRAANLEARLYGAACTAPDYKLVEICEQNVLITSQELETLGVPILMTDLGGNHCRLVSIEANTGETRCERKSGIANPDWVMSDHARLELSRADG